MSLPPLKDEGRIPTLTGLESKLISRDQVKLCENINKAIKVKRRKTKKERNGIKFKTHKETFQKKGWLQDYLRRHDGFSSLHGPKKPPHAVENKTFISRPVFITQDRLTQHQGIFDHEVKSINIERFAREASVLEEAQTHTGTTTTESKRRTPTGDTELSHGLIQTPKVKNQEEHSLNPKSSEILGSREVETGGMKTQVSQLDPNSQQAVGKENPTSCIQGSGSHFQSTLSGSRIEDFPEEMQEAPVHEAAEDINNMLSLLKLFPGRNLVSEIRQSIMEKVKELSGTSSNQSSLSVQRKMDSICEADTSTKSLWGHSSEGGTSTRNTTWRPQGQMQSTPIRFTPLPRDGSGHTRKMVRPEGSQQILSPVLHQPVRSHQHLLMLAENSPHLHNAQLPREGLRPSKQGRHTLTCCQENRYISKHSMPVNTDSPQVRWTFTHDDLVSPHNTLQKNIKHHGNQRLVNQGWLPRQTLQDVSSEQLYTSRVRPSSSRKNQSSFDFLYNRISHNVNNSPTFQIFGMSPLESRVGFTGTSSPQSISRNHFESHHNIFHEDHRTKANRFQPEDPLGLRNTKQHLSSHSGTDMDPPQDFFCTNSLAKWRNINASNDCTKWSSPSNLRDATSVVDNRDMEWHIGERGTQKTSHEYRQWRKRPITMPPTSGQQESSFVGPPYERSLQKEIAGKLSPVTWVYPRMKLY